MAREVKNRVSLDASSFQRGTNQIRRNIKQLEKGLTIDFKRAAQLGGRAMFAVGAAGAAVGTGLAVGIKNVIQFGASLDHLKAQTGVSVSELVILKRAFEDVDVSGDQVGITLNRLTRRTQIATQGNNAYAKALKTLGLDPKALSALSQFDRFEKVTVAINRIGINSETTAAAMDLLDTSAGQLFALFKKSDAISGAAKSIGLQAQLLEKNSELFERVSTLMSRSGTKLQGFFVGIADKVVPVILPLLERLDGMDLATKGQRFGEGLQAGLHAVIGLFQNDQLGEVARKSLTVAGQEFINTVASGWQAIIVSITFGLLDAAKAFGSQIAESLSSPKTAVKLATETAGRIASATPVGFAANLMGFGPSQHADALTGAMAGAGTTEQATDKAVIAFSKRFEDMMGQAGDFAGLIDTSETKAEIAKLINDAIKTASPAGPRLGPQTRPEQIETFQTPAAIGAEVSKAFVGGVSSLAAIGGGGGVGTNSVESLVDQSREQTTVLKGIWKSIDTLGSSIRTTLYGTPQPTFLS